MRVAQLRDFAASGVVVGAHTDSHPIHSALPAPERRAEILGSRLELAAMLGRPVDCFAYPFGHRDSYDDATVVLVAAAGCRAACIDERAPVTARSDPFRMPRLYVHDWDAAEFRARLLSAFQC